MKTRIRRLILYADPVIHTKNTYNRNDAGTGRAAIGHNRYSTTGSSEIANAQPIVVQFKHGQLAAAHNGNLVRLIRGAGAAEFEAFTPYYYSSYEKEEE